VSADVTHCETVAFELFNPWRAERLSERLRHRWHSGVSDGDEAALVTVELRLEEGDLAALLRAVARTEMRIARLERMNSEVEAAIARLEQQCDDGTTNTVRRLRLVQGDISTALDRLARRHDSLS
jgi:hypothetical protein